MLSRASSSFPTWASHLGDSKAKKDMMKMMPAKMMCMMVASIHCFEVLLEMWRDVPQFAK